MARNIGDSCSKINQQLLTAPRGAVLTLKWLNDRGISPKLANYYVSSGWLHRVGAGAFTTTAELPSWIGAVFGLQQKSEIHPGGITALELAGRSHFLSLGDPAINLFGRKGERLPAWFRNLSRPRNVHFLATEFLPLGIGLQEHRAGNFTIKIAGEERAVLEFLHEQKTDAAGYEHMQLIFESLGTLRANVVQALLENCSSVKVKRLFLYLAEEHLHPWFKELNVEKIPLGVGKRMLFSGGRLDKKYLITVPTPNNIPADAP